jgi:hypothetical protein
MARTFVRVELVQPGDQESVFSAVMIEAGFMRTITGRPSRKVLQLPSGMYFIEGKTPLEALGLAREISLRTAIEVRIFCVPAGGDIRFGNLAFDDIHA